MFFLPVPVHIMAAFHRQRRRLPRSVSRRSRLQHDSRVDPPVNRNLYAKIFSTFDRSGQSCSQPLGTMLEVLNRVYLQRLGMWQFRCWLFGQLRDEPGYVLRLVAAVFLARSRFSCFLAACFSSFFGWTGDVPRAETAPHRIGLLASRAGPARDALCLKPPLVPASPTYCQK